MARIVDMPQIPGYIIRGLSKREQQQLQKQWATAKPRDRLPIRNIEVARSILKTGIRPTQSQLKRALMKRLTEIGFYSGGRISMDPKKHLEITQAYLLLKGNPRSLQAIVSREDILAITTRKGLYRTFSRRHSLFAKRMLNLKDALEDNRDLQDEELQTLLENEARQRVFNHLFERGRVVWLSFKRQGKTIRRRVKLTVALGLAILGGLYLYNRNRQAYVKRPIMGLLGAR